MKTIFLTFCLAILLSFSLVYPQEKIRTIKSPDGKTIVKIISNGKSGNPGSESKIEILTVKGELLKAKSYFSDDHSHGFCINQAEWTKNSKYFVFNTTSSGGHQPGHLLTSFWIRNKNKIEELDPSIGIWVTSDFKLSEHDSITVKISDKMPDGKIKWNLKKTISLNDLVKSSLKKR